MNGSYCCACVDEEVQEEALAAPGGAEDQRVADVLVVQVVGERRAVGRLEDGERFGGQRRRRAGRVSRVNRKLRSAAWVSSSASRRRLWAPLPGTMASQAFRRL